VFSLFLFKDSHRSNTRKIKSHGVYYDRIFKQHVLNFLGHSLGTFYKVAGLHVRFCRSGVLQSGFFYGALRLGRLDGAGRIICTTKDAVKHDGVFLGTEGKQDSHDVLFGKFTRGSFEKSSDADDQKVFDCVEQGNHCELESVLFRSGANPNAYHNRFGKTALIRAAEKRPF
jgi:hypothetical protein